MAQCTAPHSYLHHAPHAEHDINHGVYNVGAYTYFGCSFSSQCVSNLTKHTSVPGKSGMMDLHKISIMLTRPGLVMVLCPLS